MRSVYTQETPCDANMLIVLDAGRSVSSLLGVFKAVPGVPNATEEATPGGKPAYIGVALVLKENHALIHVFIPACVVGQIRKMLEPLLDRKD